MAKRRKKAEMAVREHFGEGWTWQIWVAFEWESVGYRDYPKKASALRAARRWAAKHGIEVEK